MNNWNRAFILALGMLPDICCMAQTRMTGVPPAPQRLGITVKPYLRISIYSMTPSIDAALDPSKLGVSARGSGLDPEAKATIQVSLTGGGNCTGAITEPVGSDGRFMFAGTVYCTGDITQASCKRNGGGHGEAWVSHPSVPDKAHTIKAPACP